MTRRRSSSRIDYGETRPLDQFDTSDMKKLLKLMWFRPKAATLLTYGKRTSIRCPHADERKNLSIDPLDPRRRRSRIRRTWRPGGAAMPKNSGACILSLRRTPSRRGRMDDDDGQVQPFYPNKVIEIRRGAALLSAPFLTRSWAPP